MFWGLDFFYNSFFKCFFCLFIQVSLPPHMQSLRRFCFDAECLGEGGNNISRTSSAKGKISHALTTFYLFF